MSRDAFPSRKEKNPNGPSAISTLSCTIGRCEGDPALSAPRERRERPLTCWERGHIGKKRAAPERGSRENQESNVALARLPFFGWVCERS